ncbi:DUF3185 domain-containing protein [candidate division KSB1 bacterium]|nr:DUF3185 domain-containing protein [candidate division KSB1 bacterium]
MLIGIVPLVLGIVVAFACQGITCTTHEKIIAMGPIQVSAEIQKIIPLPPLLDGSAPGNGIELVIFGCKK